VGQNDRQNELQYQDVSTAYWLASTEGCKPN